MAQNLEETKANDSSPTKLAYTGLEVFVKSLPFTTTSDEVEQFFSECGTVENVNLLRDRTGRLKGTGFVRFGNKESVQKALAKNGKELGGRQLVIELAQPKEERGPQRGQNAKSVFVGNLNYATTEEDIRDFFSDCGEIKAVRLATDRDGSSKGFAHIDFENENDADKAVKKSGQTLSDRKIRVDYANTNRNDRGGDFRRGGRGRGGFSGSRGGFSGSRGGFSGSRGGFSGSRGGFSGSRGGFSGSRGGSRGESRGGYSGSRGGFRSERD